MSLGHLVRRSVPVGLAACALSAYVSISAASASTQRVGAKPTSTAALGTPAQQRAMESLYDSAIKVGRTSVVIYGPGVAGDQPFFNAFHDEFPDIKVISQNLEGPELTTRLDAEKSSGKHVADFLLNGDTPEFQLAGEGYCATEAPIYDVPSKWRHANGEVFDNSVALFAEAYNTKELTAAQAPASWQALLAPKWKGKVALDDPKLGEVSAYTFVQMLNEYQAPTYGTAFLKKLAKQDLQFSTGAQAVAEVADGQYPVAILVYSGDYLAAKVKGAPIRYKLFTSANQWSGNANCVLPTAPDKAAAQLYLNWLFSPQGQRLGAAQGQFGVMPGAPDPTGLGQLPPLNKISLLRLLPPKQQVSFFSKEDGTMLK
ncbi:MAG: ABC transporter substrate-binding protein, partial [Nitrososphaerales archaeon]